jgi:hypothetical protein
MASRTPYPVKRLVRIAKKLQRERAAHPSHLQANCSEPIETARECPGSSASAELDRRQSTSERWAKQLQE